MPRAVVTTLNSRIPQLSRQMRGRAVQGVRNTAFRIQTRIRLSFAGPKSGQLYGRHRASAPGEPPAIDTGALTNSVQVVMENDLTAYIFTNQAYAPPLEFGSRRMAARPFMLPAADAERQQFVDDLRSLL